MKDNVPRYLLAFVLILLPTALSAADEPLGSAGTVPEKISFLVTFGEEKCPEAEQPDEIVVCATAPEGDRFRIPKALREAEAEAVANQSWTSAVETLDDGARVTRPNSCSVVGSGGFTGCTQAMLRDWFAARRGKAGAN